ncbi:hypothetical protein [Dyella acidiphila]|uniref:Uncharacterized protein n=1 Tax=Dyella acidiphila TaxID=2775866 RepID=A0ABR9GE64_9GAMM|nr:hypothetical protein [Dyella acidiphila]MBE1162340.1 hypothetical protein [Dyella acidiphila]
MDSEAYFKRVQEIWFGKLSERYARALSLAFVTWIATSFAIRFDWNWLSNLTTSILDAKPLVFFLLCWCVVRIFELSRVTFFKAKGGDSKLSRRLLDGTTDAATVKTRSGLSGLH